MNAPRDRQERNSDTGLSAAGVEGAARVVILAGVGLMAGAASFTHMHDWTMANVPAGTGDWFGWANAIASELTPTVAVLDIRKRRRAGITGRGLMFPGAVLVGAVALSLSAQFARATPSISGWLLAAVPAVAFLVLTKMVLSGNHTSTANTRPHDPGDDTAPVHASRNAEAGGRFDPHDGTGADNTEGADHLARTSLGRAPKMPAPTVPPATGGIVVPPRINGAAVSR